MIISIKCSIYIYIYIYIYKENRYLITKKYNSNTTFLLKFCVSLRGKTNGWAVR